MDGQVNRAQVTLIWAGQTHVRHLMGKNRKLKADT